MSRRVRVPASFAGPLNQDHEKPHGQGGQDHVESKIIPWRSIGNAAISVGVPVGMGLLHPALGAAVFLTELAVSLIVLGTVLFGAKEYSERAFRLLRWIAGRPEPDAPSDNTAGQAIGLGPATTRVREDDHQTTVKAEIVPIAGRDGIQEIADVLAVTSE